MPSSPIQRFGWDANVLLALVNGEEPRVQHVRAFLDDAEKGQLEIVTSMLSVVDVAFAAEEKANGQLDLAIRNKIEALWQPTSPVSRVEFHFGIAQDARELIRTAMAKQWSLKAADAVHLATAARMNVTVFHTYEKESTRERWAALLGNISVEEPFMPPRRCCEVSPTWGRKAPYVGYRHDSEAKGEPLTSPFAFR